MRPENGNSRAVAPRSHCNSQNDLLSKNDESPIIGVMKTTLSRKQREVQGRQERILELARSMIVRDGYHGLSMDRIAEALEYSKGTIYQHFTCKEEILMALVNQTMERRLHLFQRAAAFRGRLENASRPSVRRPSCFFSFIPTIFTRKTRFALLQSGKRLLNSGAYSSNPAKHDARKSFGESSAMPFPSAIYNSRTTSEWISSRSGSGPSLSVGTRSRPPVRRSPTWGFTSRSRQFAATASAFSTGLAGSRSVPNWICCRCSSGSSGEVFAAESTQAERRA